MNTNMYKVWVGNYDGTRSAEFIAEAEAPSQAFLTVAQHLNENPFYEIIPHEGMPLAVKGMTEEENTFYKNSRSRHLGSLPVMIAYGPNLSMEGVEPVQYQVPPINGQ